MRGSRVAFFFMEILAVYFILYGKNYIRSRKTHLLLSIGILFFLFMLSDSRLEINSGFLDAIPGFINLTQIEETLLLRLMSILGFIALAILIAVKKGNAYILAGYCSAMLFIWPLLCGTLKMKAGEIMDQTYAFGSWRLASKFTNSTNAYEIDQYAELIDWTRKSSRQNDFFYTFVSETLGQKLKLATLRPGLGDLRDNSLYCKDGARLAIIMERIIKEFSAKDNKYKIFKETLKKYNVNYIVIDKELYGNVVDKLSNMPVAFQNKKYIVYTANSDKL
jgi:hypothetical protein